MCAGLERLGDVVDRAFVVDITRPHEVYAAFAAIGRVDVLINNAGVVVIAAGDLSPRCAVLKKSR
jgi:NADP-dependent 3-hydroxy acid dehydrogenase YdfG